MTENKLEGFEDFDNLLGDAEGEADAGDTPDEGGGGDFAGDLDDLLGDDTGTEDAGGDADAGGAEAETGADSELDSFFEDLSTIDDLEVLQEDEAPAAAADDDDDGGVGMDDDDVAVPAAPVAAAAQEPARRDRKPREKKKRGFFGKLFRWIILLAILGGGGYFVYQFFFPDFQPPWEVMEKEKDRLVSVIEEQLRREPKPELVPTPPPAPAPPPVVRRAPPKPAPAPRPAAPPPERGPWSIQVATCFFPSCLDSYRSYLQAQQRSVLIRDKTSQSESLEIFSITTWRDRAESQDLADQVNREHPLEGHAFIFREDGGYRISMGAFADLGRANIVKDALNEQYRGNLAFATRVKAFPYKLQSILTGRFPTRADAETALAKLKNDEPRLKDAFVTRNQ